MGSNGNFKDFDDEIGNFGLARQSSVYSLTFDEFQTSMGGFGKDFGSMNMDELLKNIWSAEENQMLASSVGGGAGAIGGNGDGGGFPSGSHLQRQGSITLPRTMSQKTVDEVWRDFGAESGVVGKEFGGGGGGGGVAVGSSNLRQRQQTLGEMTLEEFLVRAGIVREDVSQSQQIQRPNNDNASTTATTSSNLSFGIPQPTQNSALFDNGVTLMSNSNNNNNSTTATTNNNLSFGLPQPTQNRSIFDNGVTLMNNSNNNDNNNNNQPPSLPLSFGGARSSQQQQVFSKPATTTTMSFATTPMHLAGNTQLNSLGARQMNQAMAGPTLNTSLVPRRGVLPLPINRGVANMANRTMAVSPASHHISPDVMIKPDLDSPSSLSPVPYMFSRRGKCGPALEKVIERRQKRMIKNRESAARSRARKQAYTMELEAEVAKLKEINDELQRKQDEILEVQKNQILEAMNQQWKTKTPYLKRTFTGPW